MFFIPLNVEKLMFDESISDLNKSIDYFNKLTDQSRLELLPNDCKIGYNVIDKLTGSVKVVRCETIVFY